MHSLRKNGTKTGPSKPIGFTEEVVAAGPEVLERAPKYDAQFGIFTPWLNADEAAAFLGLEKSVFRNLASSGEIPRHTPGGGRRYRYYAPELTDWQLSQ